jgi:ABC-type multidrug transport system fused ATPase/permease subunit
MYNNYEGQILINGNSLKEIKEEDYFSKIGIIYQTPFIFNDTLLKNITLYKDYDKRKTEKLITELDLIRIKDEIYSGKVFKDSENNLSGGEKQKISLARILYENKSFIFLDEATSSIDLKSSRKIENDLLTKEGITLVNIEHKINPETVSFYDEIVCIENGKVEKIIKSREEKDLFINEL